MRGTLNRVLAVFLFVAAVTIAVGSTLVAMRVIKERDQLKESVATRTKALDDVVMAAANTSRLKGPANAQARQEIFGPAIQGYQAILQNIAQDPDRLDEAAKANFRLAALQAKIGAGACTGSLQAGMESIRQMTEANYDVSRFPSVNDNALRMTAPMEWAVMKDTEMSLHAPTLLVSFMQATGYLRDLIAKHPQVTVFRSDLAALLEVSGTLQTIAPGRAKFALIAWIEARDVLETLVRDEPANVGFQTRLVAALVAAANLQRQTDENEQAVANLKRAVELRQQMADANPEDKTLAEELTKAKSSLEKAQAAGPSVKKDESASADAAAAESEAATQ